MELAQEIIQYLPQKDQFTLWLVSEFWRRVTPDDVFTAIDMNGCEAAIGWLGLPDNFKNRIMNCCRSLSCEIDNIEHRSNTPFHTFFTKDLHGFKQLTSLRLAAVYLDDYQLIKDSQPQIKDLTLDNCHSTLEGFATLVNNFPELTHLTLINIIHLPIQQEKVPPPLFNSPSQSPRKLSLVTSSLDSAPILKWTLSGRWDKVSVLRGNDWEQYESRATR